MAHGMIERIASTIQQMHGEPDQSWEPFADTAYAVVRDLREPSQAMIAAAEGKTGAEAWAAMLDVALSEHTDLDSDEAMEAAEAHIDDDDAGERDPIGSTGP